MHGTGIEIIDYKIFMGRGRCTISLNVILSTNVLNSQMLHANLCFILSPNVFSCNM